MKYLPPLILLTLNFSGGMGPAVTMAAEPREAQVYHCGKDGRELRDSPCPESPHKPASSVRYDEPDAADVKAARERARSDARQADAMQRQRLTDEARARREAPHAGSLSAPPASAPAHHKPAAEPKPAKTPKARKPHAPKAASAPR
jgi:hypothetical protein